MTVTSSWIADRFRGRPGIAACGALLTAGIFIFGPCEAIDVSDADKIRHSQTVVLDCGATEDRARTAAEFLADQARRHPDLSFPYRGAGGITTPAEIVASTSDRLRAIQSGPCEERARTLLKDLGG